MTPAERLLAESVCLLSAAELSRFISAETAAWRRFSSHWDDLAPDCYAAELGTTRLRRYGHFKFTRADGAARLLPHDAFVQPQGSNRIYLERVRHFEPLTGAFVSDPLLGNLIRMLGAIAATLDDAAEWSAKVTPFRVLASAGGGDPTPEGPHRDGVTLVTSLLIGRHNVVGGKSTVYDLAGVPIFNTTLRAPGTMLLGDDRRTLHGVSPIRPFDPDHDAMRDMLVITFAPYQQPDHPQPRQGRGA
jgi:hypothetical protein